MDQILIYATILAPVVTGLVEIVKRTVGPDAKWLPVFALVIGIVIGVIYGITIGSGEWLVFAWGGLIAGMASVAVYELVTKVGE